MRVSDQAREPFIEYIIERAHAARSSGHTTLALRARDIHKAMGLDATGEVEEAAYLALQGVDQRADAGLALLYRQVSGAGLEGRYKTVFLFYLIPE